MGGGRSPEGRNAKGGRRQKGEGTLTPGFPLWAHPPPLTESTGLRRDMDVAPSLRQGLRTAPSSTTSVTTSGKAHQGKLLPLYLCPIGYRQFISILRFLLPPIPTHGEIAKETIGPMGLGVSLLRIEYLLFSSHVPPPISRK